MRVQYSIADHSVVFQRPPPNNPISLPHVPIGLLFQTLDHDQLVNLLEAVLLESRILFVSSQLSALTTAAETLLCLLYPFKWQHVYIPLLPAVSPLRFPLLVHVLDG